MHSYSFIFSPRPGTPAAKKKINNLRENEIKLKKLQKILEDFQSYDNKKFLQKNCEVLIENKLDNQSKYFGRTKYMTPVIIDAIQQKPKNGELAKVKINSFNQKNLFGVYKINNDEERAA